MAQKTAQWTGSNCPTLNSVQVTIPLHSPLLYHPLVSIDTDTWRTVGRIMCQQWVLDSLKPGRSGCHFADIFILVFLYENYHILFEIHWCVFLSDKKSALVQIIERHLTGDIYIHTYIHSYMYGPKPTQLINAYTQHKALCCVGYQTSKH